MTDKIKEIRARQKDGAPGQMPIAALCQCDADREFLLAEVERMREEIRRLGLSEPLAKHSGSPSREWHSVGAWLYAGETIRHVFRSPREEPEAKP